MQKTKKYLGGITAAAVLTIGLVGCGSASSKESVPSTTTRLAVPKTTTTVKPSKSVMTDALVDVLQDEFPGASRSQVIEVAEQACVVVRLSGSVEEALLMIASDPNTDSTMAGDMAYVMGVSIPVFCPEYMDELESLSSR